MVSKDQELHFVLFPLMAQGHMIPMVDIAKLLAQRGEIVTIITTPHNASRFETTVSRAKQSGLHIQILQLEYPCEEAGLPKGCENIDLLPSLGLGHEFFAISSFLQEPAEKLLQQLKPKPSCIISDSCLPYTMNLAQKLDIPRIAFQGFNCFFNVVLQNIHIFTPYESMSSEFDYFSVPGLPDHIEMTKAQMPRSIPPKLKDYQDKILEAEKHSYGLVVNSFEELEPSYVDEMKKRRGSKIWCVGPVSLCNDDNLVKAQRGNKASIDELECLKWLDSWELRSVIYVCFGSLCNLIPGQLIELALGLESSSKPFIWVIRKGSTSKELEKWIEEDGFEERIKGRGLLIKGWAPQVLILSHPSIGGFMTHCGWNSILEGISSGVPMVTWPLFADQFLNEKLVVQVLQIAVGVGVELPVNWGEEEKTEVQIKQEQVKEAVDRLMDEGEDSKVRRQRVRELSEMAKRAMAEGGSSHLNITMLIEDIMKQVGCADSN